MTIVVWSRSCISKNSAEIFVIYYGFEKNSHFSPKLGHCVGLWLKAPRDYCYSEVRLVFSHARLAVCNKLDSAISRLKCLLSRVNQRVDY